MIEKIICLDAGHYGKYNRSPVVPEYYESDMTWKLCNYLAEELKSYGFKVLKTRDNKDKDLDLVLRGEKAKGCILFISLHSNAADAESVDRPVGIYLVEDDKTSIDETSKEIADLLANVVRNVMQTNDNAKTYSRAASYDRNKDGEENDNYYGVLFGAHNVGIAGIILEHSFHTNKRAAKWLLNDNNLKTLAKEEAKALAKYYGMKKKEVETIYRIQVGAFKNKKYAEDYLKKVKAAGFNNAFITSSVVEDSKQIEPEVTFKVGDKVKIQADATVYGSNKRFSSWVYNSVLYVREVEGSRIVISTLKTGATTGSVNKKYLTKI